MSQHINIQTKRILSDAHTPVSVYLKMRDLYSGCILLESSDYYGNEKNYSYICFDDLCSIEVKNGLIKTSVDKRYTNTILHSSEVTGYVNNFLNSFTFQQADNDHLQGKFFGHINYDSVRYFDTIELPPTSDENIPDLRLHAYKYVIVFDHYHHSVYLTQHSFNPDEESELSHIESALRMNYFNNFYFKTQGEETSDCSDDDYKEIVNRGISHCQRGDVFQIVLSRSFSRQFKGDEFNVYRALRMINPSPYLFYFDYGDYRIFGSSPEAQIKVKNGKAIIHPIAGTAKRTGNREEDEGALEALINDAKENAEHVMLVDLARNDLSKSFGKVDVAYFKNIQEFSHVVHMVSEVTGKDAQHDNILQMMGETFPAGTLSGAPKFKAMELINSLEFSSRSFYGGCAGFMQPGSETNQAIMIRSFLSKDHTLHFRAGAGITVNSIPENELNEVSHKLKALRAAISLAQETTMN